MKHPERPGQWESGAGEESRIGGRERGAFWSAAPLRRFLLRLFSSVGRPGTLAAMHVDFLLGPAGSGKTTRCLQEIRAALADPDGPPLLLLAPKQATFQLERQILATGEIAGYARLQILSFERLADLVLEHFDGAPPRLIEEEGRLMVLRALLMEQQKSLKIFQIGRAHV